MWKLLSDIERPKLNERVLVWSKQTDWTFAVYIGTNKWRYAQVTMNHKSMESFFTHWKSVKTPSPGA